jgi:alkylated DNA repair dioxygenase AlkB
MASATQPSLFDAGPAMPGGFAYRPDLITRAQEAALIARIAALPLRPFEFRGYLGNRRTLSFGWRYDFNDRNLGEAAPAPEWLEPLRAAAGRFAGLEPAALEHVLVTEYAPGAGIGWHRDRPEFGTVIGVSMGSACPFRFRRRLGAGFERRSFVAEPRSAYRLAGEAREQWEHSIAPVSELRYSVTFRALRGA